MVVLRSYTAYYYRFLEIGIPNESIYLRMENLAELYPHELKGGHIFFSQGFHSAAMRRGSLTEGLRL